MNFETSNCANLSDFCDSNYLSCHFIDALSGGNNSFQIKNYSNVGEGIFELKKGRISAFLLVEGNFSAVTKKFNKNHKTKYDAMEVHLDKSSHIISSFIQEVVMQTFNKLGEKLAKCYNKNAAVPMRRRDIHGELSFDMQKTYVSSSLIM